MLSDNDIIVIMVRGLKSMSKDFDGDMLKKKTLFDIRKSINVKDERLSNLMDIAFEEYLENI